MIWRVLTSGKFTVTAAELEDRWSFSDLMEAHEVLDTLEAVDGRRTA